MLLKAPRNISEVIRTRTWLFPIFPCDNTGEQSRQDQLQALKPIQYRAPWRDELRPPSPRWAPGLTCGAVGGCSHRGPLWPASQILLLFFRVWSLSCRCLGAVLITFRGAGGTARSDLQQQQQQGQNQRVPIGYLFVPSPTSPAPGSARCPGNYVSQAPLPFGFHLDEALGRHWQKPGGREWGRSQGIFTPLRPLAASHLEAAFLHFLCGRAPPNIPAPAMFQPWSHSASLWSLANLPPSHLSSFLHMLIHELPKFSCWPLDSSFANQSPVFSSHFWKHLEWFLLFWLNSDGYRGDQQWIAVQLNRHRLQT